MISKVHIENFRSIRKADLPLGRITVLTGANNSGKSSILYGLMVLQDFVRNPNQSLEQLFALPFINLGGFSGVVSKRDGALTAMDRLIRLGISAESGQMRSNLSSYGLTLGQGHSSVNLISTGDEFSFDASMNIGLPYTGNSLEIESALKNGTIDFAKFDWNGIHAFVKEAPGFSDLDRVLLDASLNLCLASLTWTNFVPIARGFTKPYYSMVPMTGTINSEEEIATMLKVENRADTLGMVNTYLDEIAGRRIEMPTNGAPGLFSILSKNTETGQTNFLVNEGSGTNHLVTMLAKTFQFGNEFTCIDEPEIHLHPSMVRKLAKSFAQIVGDFANKQFLVSTHSEHFVQGLLAEVAAGRLAPEDLKIYHLTADENGTAIEPQAVNEKGQVEGGLSHFYESELSELKSLFKLVD